MAMLRARIHRRHVVIVVGVILVVAVAGQFALPAIAERVARGKIGDDRAQVDVRAFPAWKLVFGRIDELRVVTPAMAVVPNDLTALLRRAKRVSRGTIEIGTLTVDGVPVKLRNVRATLDHGRVAASAELLVPELAAQLPAGAAVTPEPPRPDGLPRLRASLTLLGVRTEVPIVVRASGGVLEAAGDAGVASAIRVKLFANEALTIDTLQGRFDGNVLTVRVRGTLR